MAKHALLARHEADWLVKTVSSDEFVNVILYTSASRSRSANSERSDAWRIIMDRFEEELGRTVPFEQLRKWVTNRRQVLIDRLKGRTRWFSNCILVAVSVENFFLFSDLMISSNMFNDSTESTDGSLMHALDLVNGNGGLGTSFANVKQVRSEASPRHFRNC